MGTSAAIEGFRTLLKELQVKQMKLEKDQLKLQRTVFGWKRFFLGFKKFRHTFEKIMKNNIRRDKMLKDLSYQMMQLKSGMNRKMWRTRDKVKKTYLDDSRAHDTCRNISEPLWKNQNQFRCSRPRHNKFAELVPESAQNAECFQKNKSNLAQGSAAVKSTQRFKDGQSTRLADDEILHRYLKDAVKFQQKRLSRTNARSKNKCNQIRKPSKNQQIPGKQIDKQNRTKILRNIKRKENNCKRGGPTRNNTKAKLPKNGF